MWSCRHVEFPTHGVDGLTVPVLRSKGARAAPQQADQSRSDAIPFQYLAAGVRVAPEQGGRWPSAVQWMDARTRARRSGDGAKP